MTRVASSCLGVMFRLYRYFERLRPFVTTESSDSGSYEMNRSRFVRRMKASVVSGMSCWKFYKVDSTDLVEFSIILRGLSE